MQLYVQTGINPFNGMQKNLKTTDKLHSKGNFAKLHIFFAIYVLEGVMPMSVVIDFLIVVYFMYNSNIYT